jgi:hypothetical protein
VFPWLKLSQKSTSVQSVEKKKLETKQNMSLYISSEFYNRIRSFTQKDHCKAGVDQVVPRVTMLGPMAPLFATFGPVSDELYPFLTPFLPLFYPLSCLLFLLLSFETFG